MVNGVYAVEIYTEYGQQYAKIHSILCGSMTHKVMKPSDVGELLSDCIMHDADEHKDLLDVEFNKSIMEDAERAYIKAKEHYAKSLGYTTKATDGDVEVCV